MEKRRYELALVLKPLLPEDVTSKVVEPLKGKVDELNGSSEVKEDWGKLHLAYPIRSGKSGDTFEEGYYIFLDVELPVANTKELEKQLKIMQRGDLLRYLLIREDQL